MKGIQGWEMRDHDDHYKEAIMPSVNCKSLLQSYWAHTRLNPFVISFLLQHLQPTFSAQIEAIGIVLVHKQDLFQVKKSVVA